MIDQLKIKNPKVRRFIVLESDYAVNIMGKFLFYLQVLPQEISLIPNSFSDYPKDDDAMYCSYLNLEKQIEKNCSALMIKSFRMLKDSI